MLDASNPRPNLSSHPTTHPIPGDYPQWNMHHEPLLRRPGVEGAGLCAVTGRRSPLQGASAGPTTLGGGQPEAALPPVPARLRRERHLRGRGLSLPRCVFPRRAARPGHAPERLPRPRVFSRRVLHVWRHQLLRRGALRQEEHGGGERELPRGHLRGHALAGRHHLPGEPAPARSAAGTPVGAGQHRALSRRQGPRLPDGAPARAAATSCAT